MNPRKLTLKLDDLTVASFEVSETDTRKGTVHGNDLNAVRIPTNYSRCWSMCVAFSDCCSEYPGVCTTDC
jgi:hypothetical protein